ncbi:serine/threonine protein kinase [Mesorhizobium sp. B2-3-13]|uniref:serine/threonine-protein kinase n=1 Tax=Mesorhizobium sp. B2-3-13 TaxID=2589951 RepID=UPI00112C376E|nr:serine/threonine-protein kinase [Mesorhizobium sp. B2-3-13]TPL79799.1 serine/threonine protein kinase [Mesorhizobium sp. B2-3-13]
MSDDDKTRLSAKVTYAGAGTQLSGIYELDERIASGGMGEVYRGHNIQTGDHVAIKIVLPEFARDQTILSLFRKEASILNHLSHDAVVRYHVFTIDPKIGRPYLAMEFVDGQSLFDVMRRGPMPGEEVRRLCHRLASGLAAVHQAGAVHRDLSPDNIILPGGRVERAKIIDFGIARSAAAGGETLIGGKFAGKYNYVSPEQLGLYGGEVSEQSDIYSLGLVLAAVLRGKPLDMSGTQYDVVEKRRTVPDLSDIDPNFHELVGAMLQPDPRDRPASMADIARATRDEDVEVTLPPAAYGSRERSGLPRAGWTALPKSRVQPSAPPGEQRFVEHVRPAHLSQPRSAPTPAPASTTMPPRKSSRMPAIAGSLAALVLLLGGGLYFRGILAPPPAEEKLKPLIAKPVAQAPQPEASKPQPHPPVQPRPEPSKTDNAGTFETVKPPALPDVKAKTAIPAENQADAAGEQPATKSQANNNPPQVPGVGIKPAQTPTANPPTAASVPKAEESAKVPKPVSQPPETSAPSQAEAEGKPAQEADLPATKPSATDLVNRLSKLAKPQASPPPIAQRPVPTQPTTPPAEPAAPLPPAIQPPATVPSEPTQTAQSSQQPPPVTIQPENTEVAMNVPKPAVPPATTGDETAQRASWVRDFSGGDCFYASLTSEDASAVAIEGFATAVQPFEQLLNEFRARFHLEPDISVRLIDQPQCEVTRLLRFLDRNRVDSPRLVLDRTSVPDGAPISGTLATHGGLVSNVMLIDHRGIAFNLDDRMVAQTDKATFSIPIGLGAADKAAGKPLPQIMLVITGPHDIQAAMFSRPTPASDLLPKILEEIEADGSQFSAAAKYFRLGG